MTYLSDDELQMDNYESIKRAIGEIQRSIDDNTKKLQQMRKDIDNTLARLDTTDDYATIKELNYQILCFEDSCEKLEQKIRHLEAHMNNTIKKIK